jgi:hypothetical protein
MMHKSLLIEFSKALGFESLPNDCFALSVDNKFDINVGYQEESEEIIFVSYIAPLANTQDDTRRHKTTQDDTRRHKTTQIIL